MIYRNLFLTFLLGGLWHGAAWTFIVLGALHGLGCCVHRWWSSAGHRMPKLAGIIVTFLFVNMTWVYFRAPDLRNRQHPAADHGEAAARRSALLFAVRPLLVVSALAGLALPEQPDPLPRRIGAGASRSRRARRSGWDRRTGGDQTPPSPRAFIYYNFMT